MSGNLPSEDDSLADYVPNGDDEDVEVGPEPVGNGWYRLGSGKLVYGWTAAYRAWKHEVCDDD